MAVLESSLRQILRDELRFPSGTVSFVEFARGGDPGLPDSLILVGKLLCPLELKRGTSVVASLRPTQRSWHKLALDHGAACFGLAVDHEWTIRLFKIQVTSRVLNEVLIDQTKPDILNYQWLLLKITRNF